MLKWILTIAVLAFFSAGCRQTVAPPAKQSLTEGKEFSDAKAGFSVRYPADWLVQKDAENVLTVIAPGGKPNGAKLSIAVPKLPVHVPGLIPLGPVQSGYLDDLRERMKDVQSQDGPPITINGAKAKRFGATGKDRAGDRKLAVLLIVKGDRLYILTAESSASDFPSARAALDLAAGSWKWLN